MRRASQRCRFCVFFTEHRFERSTGKRIEKEFPDTGYCRFAAPTNDSQMWPPSVNYDDWCGSYEYSPQQRSL